MAATLVQVRIDDDLKNQATAVYDTLGIYLSTAVSMFLKRLVMALKELSDAARGKWYIRNVTR